MSARRPTMKTIQKRFCTALPRAVSSPSTSTRAISRVRSNSVSSSRPLYTANSSGPLAFFDSPPPPPPPPSSRPGNPHVLSTSRLPVKVEGEGSSHSTSPHPHNSPHGHGQTSGQPPFSLALTSPQANSSSPPVLPASHQSAGFFPYTTFPSIPFCNVALSDHSDSRPRVKRHRVRYHLDVGAYGIPKHAKKTVKPGIGNSGAPPGCFFQDVADEDLSLAVQVGEDAYFIRENAMGVADGVGGWSRTRDSCTSSRASVDPSPSALFARRLMHHCSAETLGIDAHVSRQREASPVRSASPRHTGSTALNGEWPWNTNTDQLTEELEDSLEDLEDGLDILMILERAYEKTIKAHVVAEQSTPSASLAQPFSLPCVPEDHLLSKGPSDTVISTPTFTPPPETPTVPQPKLVPLKTGSSTALVAVLQHLRPSTPPHPPLHHPVLFNLPVSSKHTYDAVLKIAHLGDCMGMLVRDEHIAWRSTEMWWAFNTPVQLGPSSSARPGDAQILELPVQADDILILASDGLSDNLWDSEVLDEVVRFKRSFMNDAEKCKGQGLLGRRTLAGMLSEALCSRARRVSERKSRGYADDDEEFENEVPFARRAREQGKAFKGGKIDDISVLVAVVSSASDMALN